ncbi:aminoglycoside phosphotransferase family protein [Actinoplanes bogorensis]|uniref:Aminoglycoside phosphotransferase family protein n=1 Tax=Paractinoplanes bogorensis TaxID=1610840 RepID=A0ABS5YPG2_9ACTN|nr:aminoglycoside phosphotransferase family protein [Actinoplanes bogorensis]MBU2665354.1 aminoglycoside phosphotransferase family protein [Actinoplanes bogorensis]
MEAAVRVGVEWAESVWPRRVVEARVLVGGWTSTLVGLTGEDGAQAVLRLMTKEPWRRHAAGLLERESAVQKELAGSLIPAPRSIALDTAGARAGAPAHLMTRLPGRLCLDDATDGVLAVLAGALADIHRFVPEGSRPRDYQSWAPMGKRVVPGWAKRPELWNGAFALLGRAAPAYEGTFLHRDFHLGNVLWSQGRVTGVVDWVETSWGPAALDVAHAATYLAMLHGAEAAARFTRAYGPHDEHEYWSVMDIVGYLPDPVKVAGPWRDAGLDVGDDLARGRLEEYLAQVLSMGS